MVASPNYVAGSLDTLRRGFIQAGLRGITCYAVSYTHLDVYKRQHRSLLSNIMLKALRQTLIFTQL